MEALLDPASRYSVSLSPAPRPAPLDDEPLPVTIDGDARDWDPAGVAAQARSPGLNPNADILKFGIADNVDYLAFYLEVAGNALQGGGTPRTMDTARILIDADNVATTGYRIDGLGHLWSGGTGLRPLSDSHSPDASQIFWDFLSAYTLE